MVRSDYLFFLCLCFCMAIARADNGFMHIPRPDDHPPHRGNKLAGPAEMPSGEEPHLRMNEVPRPPGAPNGGGPEAGPPLRPRNQLTVDERHALRRQINEAGNMYGKQRP